MSLKSKGIRICLVVSAFLLFLVAIASLILVLVFDKVFAKLLAEKLPLLPGSEVLDNWIKPTVPVYFTVYLFNLTNPERVLAGERPNLSVVGPFTYRETREKFAIKFSSEAKPKRLRFKQRIFYHYVPGLSVDIPESSKITTIDMIYMELVGRDTISFFNYELFVKLSPHEFMWDYTTFISSLGSSLSGSKTSNAGFFALSNETTVFEFTVDTGVDDIQNIARIYDVDGKSVMNVWDVSEANMINGTDGSIASPGLEVGSEVTFHVPDICRSATSYAIGQTTTKNRDDVDVIVFSPTSPKPDDPLVQWREKMFCEHGITCPPKGLISLRPCLKSNGFKVPMYMSQPYFLGGDPELRAAINGLPEPNEEEHATRVHIEPNTGFVLEAFKKVQFNVLLNRETTSIKKIKKPIYFPVAWVIESAVADKATLDMLYTKLLRPKKLIPIILSIVGAVALLFCVSIVCVLLMFIRIRRRRSKPTALVSSTIHAVTSVTSTYDSAMDTKPFVQDTNPTVPNLHYKSSLYTPNSQV
ncbi:unnamed protein product [Calicophoron daubneyi]|uniref:Uncharacterized protein n=1 Tax=Calicophoron daubneyi TaxID=300641 RepID=A0AAV2SZU1_CALDB